MLGTHAFPCPECRDVSYWTPCALPVVAPTVVDPITPESALAAQIERAHLILYGLGKHAMGYVGFNNIGTMLLQDIYLESFSNTSNASYPVYRKGLGGISANPALYYFTYHFNVFQPSSGEMIPFRAYFNFHGCNLIV